MIKTRAGASPWPSGEVHALRFNGPGFPWFGSWAWAWHHSSSHAEAECHMPQLEGPTTRLYNYVLGGTWEKKEKKKGVREGEGEEKEDWQQIVSSGANL